MGSSPASLGYMSSQRLAEIKLFISLTQPRQATLRCKPAAIESGLQGEASQDVEPGIRGGAVCGYSYRLTHAAGGMLIPSSLQAHQLLETREPRVPGAEVVGVRALNNRQMVGEKL